MSKTYGQHPLQEALDNQAAPTEEQQKIKELKEQLNAAIDLLCEVDGFGWCSNRDQRIRWVDERWALLKLCGR